MYVHETRISVLSLESHKELFFGNIMYKQMHDMDKKYLFHEKLSNRFEMREFNLKKNAKNLVLQKYRSK